MLKTAKWMGAISALILFAGLTAPAQTSNWTIDPNHSTAQFTVRHLAISNVSGNFAKVMGTVALILPTT